MCEALEDVYRKKREAFEERRADLERLLVSMRCDTESDAVK